MLFMFTSYWHECSYCTRIYLYEYEYQGLHLIGIRFTYTIMMWVATQSKFACLHLLANLKFLLMNTIIILSKYQFLCILFVIMLQLQIDNSSSFPCFNQQKMFADTALLVNIMSEVLIIFVYSSCDFFVCKKSWIDILDEIWWIIKIYTFFV